MSETTEPGPARPAGTSRRVKYALIASLALNLLVLGIVAGSMLGFGKHHPRFGGHPRGEDFGLMGLTRTLPEERRKEIRKQLRDDRVKLRPLVEDIRTERREAADKLDAEPFDRAALESAISAVTGKEQAMRQEAVSIFLGHVERLSADERRTLAEWWRKKSQPLPERKSKKDETADAPAN
ncbi:periplasmic heavy metal sensor [Hyphomicrobium sp.]|uniref:periplasmic heavy metal sensor n=1 Tax=Hyphomicrobium sp. TaxID=82 RepID=UPI0025C06C79|nr:periplasmic heavy metal sensor [Hyphomicrobium sp.]MCC7253736.1 periplasmic heavy metal sensor [Hyphomicrobium sp.]